MGFTQRGNIYASNLTIFTTIPTQTKATGRAIFPDSSSAFQISMFY